MNFLQPAGSSCHVERHRRGVLRELFNLIGERLFHPMSGAHADHFFGNGATVLLQDALIPALLRIRNRQGHLIPFAPNAAQISFARNRTRCNIILKARQMGMTTYLCGRLFLATALRPGTTALQVAHNLESAQQIFRIVHRFLATLHPLIGPTIITDRSNVREMAFAEIDSRFRVESAGNSGAGRGLTLQHLHASEVSEWPGKPEETMAALVAGVAPTGTVDLEATPRGVGGYFHREWTLAKGDEGGYRRHFFPWWLEKSYRKAVEPGECMDPDTDEEKRLVAECPLDKEQLKFRRGLELIYRGLRAQEFAENDVECFLASTRSVFDSASIDHRMQHLPHPIAICENGAELEFAPPVPGRAYVIGADPAEGRLDGDFSAAQVVDARTGMQCLELAVRWPVERFAAHLAALGLRFNDALIAVERNNVGHAVNYALRYRHNYRRLYRHSLGAGDLDVGWPTNLQTKPQIIGALHAFLSDAPEVFSSQALLEEMRAYSYDSSGSTAAPQGMHDDLVMAMGIALAVRSSARVATVASFPSEPVVI